MARYPAMWTEEKPQAPQSDPMKEELEKLKAEQAEREREYIQRQAEDRGRMEAIQRMYEGQNEPEPQSTQIPVPDVPQYSHDELLSDPTKIHDLMAAQVRQGQIQMANVLTPELEKASEGTYTATKLTMGSHPYYKYAEAEMDKYFKSNPGERGDSSRVRAKFNEIVGANMDTYQRKLEADAPKDTSRDRRLPVVEQQVQPGSTQAAPAEESKPNLSDDEEHDRKLWSRLGVDIPAKEWETIRDNKWGPGQRARGK